MPSYSGLGPPDLARRVLDGVRLRAGVRLERVVTVAGGAGPPLRFRVRTIPEYNRATHALASEPGTLAWLAAEIRPGDVFYDVGANVGVFSLLAAHRAGPQGRVIACEPHAATVATLLENVALNGLTERIEVLSCALYRSTGHQPFLYRSLAGGSGLSQVDATRDPWRQDVAPVARELKAVAAVDDLIAAGTIPPAHVIKIDVDGREADVLAGMRGLLTGASRPRTVQVEVNPDGAGALMESMAAMGYRETRRHRTAVGERLVREGADPATVGANVVFHPAP